MAVTAGEALQSITKSVTTITEMNEGIAHLTEDQTRPTPDSIPQPSRQHQSDRPADRRHRQHSLAIEQRIHHHGRSTAGLGKAVSAYTGGIAPPGEQSATSPTCAST